MKEKDEQEPDASALKELFREMLSALEPALAAQDDDPLHQVPEPLLDLPGREAETAELQEQIESGIAAGLVLQGPPGVGKTALACELASELSPLYSHAQLYFDLRGDAGHQPRTPAEAMAHVIHAYQPMLPTLVLPEVLDELSELYRAALRGQRTVLMLDNVANAAQLEPLLPPAGCVLLATARETFAIPDTLPGIYAKELGPLAADDSRTLLLNIAPDATEQADALVELCGGLPLAVWAAAGGLTTRVKIEPADYLARLTELRRVLDPVTAALTLNYELLAPRRQQLWCKLAVFPASFDENAATTIWEMEPSSPREARASLVERALEEFCELGLLESDDEGRRYWLPMTARTLAQLTPAEAQALARRHARHYVNAVQAAQIMYKAGSAGIPAAFALCEHEFLNITAGQAWAAAHAASDPQAAEWTVDYFSSGIAVLIYRLRHSEIKRWLRDASEAARSLGDPAKESAMLGELASAYHDLKYDQLAREYFQKALAVARAANDEESERRALGGLGDIYQSLGEMDEAIAFYQQYLDIVRAAGDQRAESYLLNNLGAAYGKLQRTEEALQCFRRQLEITRETGDQEHECRVLTNLGVVAIESGQPQIAIEHFRQGAALAHEIEDEETEAHLLDYLGGAHYLTGDYAQSATAYEQALAIIRELDDREGFGELQWKLSMPLYKLGQRARAIECAERALKIREAAQDPRAAEVRSQLAYWRSERGRSSGH